MSRTTGTYTLTSNIEPKVGAPLDARTIVKLKSDLTTPGTFAYPYVGLTVFVEEDQKKYTLIDIHYTYIANWREEGSGTTTSADHVTYDNTTSQIESTNVQDAIDEIVSNLGTAASKDATDQVTEDSTDLITSGAVYDALENLPSDDTWRSVQVNGTEVQNGTTSSGPLKLVNGTNTNVAFDSTNKTIQVNATDTNTTYTLSQDQSDGHKITLTPSSGSAQTVTIPDNNTTYTFESGTNSFKVTPSGSTAQTVNVTPSIADATTSASGLMSASDKTKLNGIANGAEVNQNAFSNVKVGNTTIQADSKTDTLELVAGSNVAITPNDTDDKVTISATDTNTTYSLTQDSSDGHKITLTPSTGTAQTLTIPDNNTTYTLSTGAANGQIKVTPSIGSAYNIDVKGLGSAAYKNSTTSVTQNSADLVTSGAVWSAIDNLPEPMIMKGTLGTGGTITSLPTASASNEGFVYKVITAGTYAGQAAKVGDFFVSCKPEGASAYSWVWFPSGDETFTDTWRSIKVNGTEKLGNAISSGAVDFVNGTNTTIEFVDDGKKIKINSSDTNTHRPIQVNGTQNLGDNTTPLNLKNGTNITVIADGGNVTIATSAEVNQNAFSNIKVGSTTVAADSKTDTLELVAGSNVTITPDATNDKITIAATDTNTHRPIQVNGTEVLGNNTTALNLKAGSNVSLTNSSGTVTIAATDTNNRKSFYGTCDTAAATAAKVVTLADTAGWELKAGTIVGIKCTNSNTAGNATLNVNGSGNKSIFYEGAVYTGSTSWITGQAGRVIFYMYDGTYWVWMNFNWHSDGNNTVTQNATTTNADYEILFSATADNTTRTEQARKNDNFKFNPSLGKMSVAGLGKSWLDTGKNPQMYLSKPSTDGAVGALGIDTKDGRIVIGAYPSANNQLTFSYFTNTTLTGTNNKTDKQMFWEADDDDLHVTKINNVTVGSSPKFTDTTYTFANGTNGFTVTPSGGTAQTVTITPSIANNITGSGTSGYLAKFNGTNTITNGPAFGSATTTYLRNDGTWATPTDTNTHRPIQMNGTEILGNNTTALNLKAGSNVTLTNSSGTVTIAATDTKYTAGTGLTLDSGAFRTYVPRLTASTDDSKTIPGVNRFNIREFGNSTLNFPYKEWYHLLTIEGSDNHYATQLALNMTNKAGVYYRKYDNSTWGDWYRLNGALIQKYQTISTTNKWYKLFTISYSQYNYAYLHLLIKAGFENMYEVFLCLRFTPNGIGAADSYAKIIPYNSSSKNVRLYQVNDTTFGLAVNAQGATSQIGFELLDMSSEADTLSAWSLTIANPFTELEAGPTAFGNHRYFTGNYADINGTPSLNYLPLAGGTMSGGITFNKVNNAIAYTGTKATYSMIKFIDNTGDEYGNGISIGGGGLTIIGGGESADAVASGKSGGSEMLYLSNDQNVQIITGVQNGLSSAKTFDFKTDGTATFDGKWVGRFTATPTSGQVVITDGTTGGIKSSGYTIAKSVPSNAIFTDTTYTVATGDSNGQIKVTPSSGSAYNVGIKGLNTMAYENKDDYRKRYLASFSGNGDSAGYCKVCTITITSAYVNGPIEIALQERGRSTVNRLYILFASVNNSDPSLSSFKVLGTYAGYYIYKVTTSKWEVYATKNEAWSGMWVIDCSLYSISSPGMTIAWNMENASLPSSDTTQATHIYATSDTNTHRPIQMNGTEILGNNTTALNLKAGSNVSLTNSSGAVTIAATNTLNTAGSTDTSSKIFLIGATSQAANPQTYSDNEVYVTSGTLQTKVTQASSTICANTANSSTAGGLSLYATDPTVYGVIFRGTGNQGTHGYVTSDWATYFTMSNSDNRGWVFRRSSSGNVASIDTKGRMVLNESVTVGSTSAGGCMQYNSTNHCIDFIVT